MLARMVASSVALKAACVSRDPREQGEAGKGRVVLNLGHTIGHALEKLSNYQLLHGEGVGLGLIAAARLSTRKGIVKLEEGEPDLEQQMRTAVASLRLPTDLDAWLEPDKLGKLESALATDKKRGFSSVSYIGLVRLGEPAVLSLAPAEIVALLRSPSAKG